MHVVVAAQHGDMGALDARGWRFLTGTMDGLVSASVDAVRDVGKWLE